MIQPKELKLNLPMEIPNAVISTTSKVWEILLASYKGDLEAVKKMVNECPELIYAQFNYTPPIHFAVREGHLNLVNFFLDNGALDPNYKIYPFLDGLLTIAQDREYNEIAVLLEQYNRNPAASRYKGDTGKIFYNRTELQNEFEKAVYEEDLEKTGKLLKEHPGLALDETYFWGEGILTFAAKENNREMVDLLMEYGAKVPNVLKWTQFYYFERFDGATYMMEKGMNPNVMSWHHVTVLHDMAQKGNIQKAELLIKHGASLNPIDEEYQTTPLGMASRWGHTEMVIYLLSQGADPNKAGSSWATPLAWARKKGQTDIEKILLSSGAR